MNDLRRLHSAGRTGNMQSRKDGQQGTADSLKKGGAIHSRIMLAFAVPTFCKVVSYADIPFAVYLVSMLIQNVIASHLILH